MLCFQTMYVHVYCDYTEMSCMQKFADNCVCCLYIVKEDYLIHHIKLASHCQTIYNTLYQGFEISQWQPFFPFSGPCQDEPSVTVYDSLSLLQ
jgi:hypothetical protein